MKKLWLAFIWRIELFLELWEYQFNKINTRRIPEFDEIFEEYLSLIQSLVILGDKAEKFEGLIKYRTSCIIMWALLWFNKDLEPTTETERLKEYIEKELWLSIKEETEIDLSKYEELNPMADGISLWELNCGSDENRKRISLSSILINFIRTED